LFRNETVTLKENDQKSKKEKNSVLDPHEPNFSRKYLIQIYILFTIAHFYLKTIRSSILPHKKATFLEMAGWFLLN